MEEYLRVVRGLLAGETLEWRFEGRRRKIRFLNPEIGAINVEDPIPARRRGGPAGAAAHRRARRGLVHATGASLTRVGHRVMQAAWREAGRDAPRISTRRRPSAAACSPTARPPTARGAGQAGPTATVALHSLVEREEFGDLGRPCRPTRPLIERYREIYLTTSPRTRAISNHRGHLMFLRPEEEAVCTAELIRATTFTRPEPSCASRYAARPRPASSMSASRCATDTPRCWRNGRSCSTACDAQPFHLSTKE